MAENKSKELVVNIFWSFLGRFGYLGVAFVANIILARILTPEDFGRMAIINFFILLATVLIESGLSGALIRKNNATEEDYSTIFIFNLLISVILIFLIHISSNSISEYYKDRELSDLLSFVSLILIINSLRITQTAKLVKEMKFKLKSLFEFVSILLASSVAIFMGYNGSGIWALVWLQVLSAIILTLLMWYYVGPLKSYKFSVKSFKSFYKFGVNTTLASLIKTGFDNVYSLIFAKYFSVAQSGYYYQAKKLQEMPLGVIQTTVLSVIYSSLSKIQDDRQRFNEVYSKLNNIFTVVVGLVCLLIFSNSEFIITTLYGEKWIDSVFYLQILIVSAFFYLQEIFNRLIFKIYDRTERILQLEILKKIIQSVTIAYALINLSIEYLLYGILLTSFFSFFINYYCARNIQKYYSWSDFLNIFLVFFACILCDVVFSLLVNVFSIKGYYVLILTPITIIFYIIVIAFFGVFNIKKDFKKIKSLF